MKRTIAAISVILFCFSTSIMAHTDHNKDHAAAKDLLVHWFSAMKDKNIDVAASFLAPAFVSIHTDGKVRNKEQEVQLMKNLDMKDFHLSDFDFADSGNVMTVTFKDITKENIDNKQVADSKAGRMAVLQKKDKEKGKKWIIIAYANMDPIK